MRGEYTFLRSGDNGIRFARVSISAHPAETWSVSLDASVAAAPAMYRESIRRGVTVAVDEQQRANGQRFAVHVEALVWTAADTTPDSVECATAMAQASTSTQRLC